jgi:hypothetical protein
MKIAPDPQDTEMRPVSGIGIVLTPEPDPTFHFDSYPDPDPTPCLTQHGKSIKLQTFNVNKKKGRKVILFDIMDSYLRFLEKRTAKLAFYLFEMNTIRIRQNYADPTRSGSTTLLARSTKYAQ